jgi:serine/threonine protein kinase
MMNRSCLLRTLQRPRAGLRKGTRRSLSASSGIGQTSGASGAAGGAAAAAAAAAEDSSDVNREIAILKKLDHPNVVKLYEVGCQYFPAAA